MDGWLPGDGGGRIGSSFPGMGLLSGVRSWRWLYSIGSIAQFKMVNFMLCDSCLKTNYRKSPVTGEEVLSEYAAKKLGKKDFIGLSVSRSILFWLL